MIKESDLKSLRNAIVAAENSIRTAKHLLTELLGGDVKNNFDASTQGLSAYNEDGATVVEWVFIGDGMLGSDGNTYPVPQNYASKSLLVQGSRLKAIIQPNGRIMYKIIEEIPYETKLGIVTKMGEKYQITTDDKTYNVLVASVTFHKVTVGDTVSIRVPKGKEATYAVIDNIVPKVV